ncbi:MAG: ribonuclease E/G [Kiloniellales bacterium]|nr:ribonuclease E/G [Kiloniellales bacterium]
MARLDNGLVISALPGILWAARVQDGVPIDITVRRDDRPEVQGNLYLGRVSRLDRALGAAFVEIGLAEPGLLPLDRLETRPAEGEALIVRVQRAPGADKGAKLTAKIPASQRRRVEAAAKTATAPALLLRADDPLDRLLPEDADPPTRVLIDDPDLLAETRRRLEGAGHTVEGLELYHGDLPLLEAAGLSERIEALLDPEVPLPGGGRLWIEPTRALTAVDVDSGGRRAGDPGRLALEVNLEAAAAAAQELRLRRLSGLIVIDFLELGPRAQRQEVVRRLRQEMKRDPDAGRVLPMSASGLVEVTRRRAGPALYELLTLPCGLHGSGRAWDPAVLAWQGLLRLRHQALGRPGGPPRLTCSPRVAAALLGPAAPARWAVAAALGREIEVLADPTLADGEIQTML